jgi:flagellar protein FliO/FliZ
MTAVIARRFLSFFHSVFFSLACMPLSALAIDSVKPAPVVAANPMNMILGLIFLLVIVGAGWWLVKRAGGLQINQGSGLKVIAALSVGPRERVVLIELAGEQWLLGVAPGNVNLLHRFEQPVLAAGSDDFAGKIRQLMQQGFSK